MQKDNAVAILILGRDTCEDTIRSRGHLDRVGTGYTYRNVELDAQADTMNRFHNDGRRITPTILLGDPDRPSVVLREPSNDELDAAIAAS